MSCRSTRDRPAPIAIRTLNSPRRAATRDASSVPTFAQEISSSISTAACRLQSVRSSVGPTNSARAGFALMAHFRFASGWSCSVLWATVSSKARVCCRETPSLKRPTTSQ